MTRKEQNKILNDKIEANNAQYNLDRMNAEISAYSCGDLPKYEYLTKKDLNYKPNAFEQADFEYSPLGKVFIDALDKSYKNEGLLKRLKNIEDRSNNQLLAIKNIPGPAIKGENNSDVNDEYKTIQDFKQELIDKNILRLDGVKKLDNIIDKWKQTKDKEIVYKNVDTKVNTKKFNIYRIFENYLNKKIDYDGIDMIEKSIKNGIKIYQKRHRTDKNKSIINNSYKVIKGIELFKSMIDNDEFKIPVEYYAKPNNDINLDWMNDKDGYEETAEEAGADYMKGKNDNESELIKTFINKINNGSINNKYKAGNEFRKLKQKVTNDVLRQDLFKDLERYMFGEGIESIEPEEKYEESITERVKPRRQNTQRTFAPSSPPKKYYSAETADHLKNMEEQEKDRKKFSDDNDSNGWFSGSGLKILTNKQMLNRFPILLAQMQAGSNSKSLKNEIRQILYSLYRSKVLTKTVYNNLIKSIIKKHETIGENAPILIYANTINNRIVFKIKSGYKLELLSKETMKLLGSTKDIIDADKNSENVPRLENVEVVLLHCNLVNNSYLQHSRVLFTFVSTKQYNQLISISPHSLVFLKTMNTDFSEIEIWFTDQNNNSLEIEDNVNISLIINTS